MTPRLSPAEKEEARRIYAADESLSIAAVAQMFGVGPTVMRDALKGILRAQGGRPKTTTTTQQMIDMRDQGMTLYQIGLQVGLSESGVLRRIQRHQDAKKKRGE